MSCSRIYQVVVYLGSCPEQDSIWAGAKELAIPALKKSGIDLIFQEISTEQLVKKLKYNEAEFVALFAKSDIHIFVDHPHQGSVKNLQWDMDVLRNELVSHLHGHPGFPTGHQVNCYVFLQDKFGYIEKLSSFFLPTLKVDLIELAENNILVYNEIDDFLRKFPSSEFVVKTGYSTNTLVNTIRCESYHAVYARLRRLYDDHCVMGNPSLKFKYAFIQQRVKNGREMKFIFFNGEYRYKQKIKLGATPKAFQCDDSVTIEFAKNVMLHVKQCVPEIIWQGIIRIDIMEDDDANLFVNELESLGADLLPQRADIDMPLYAKVKTHMSQLYADVLIQNALTLAAAGGTVHHEIVVDELAC
jgi:hypothetical protein